MPTFSEMFRIGRSNHSELLFARETYPARNKGTWWCLIKEKKDK